ncbi:hypothetical protein [Bremerella sp. P1]|nr:hypothetical protein [Bremerella sp. P1]WDI40233.1 hypothetical protein PSR63_17270 [Bremerella sp. P1]
MNLEYLKAQAEAAFQRYLAETDSRKKKVFLQAWQNDKLLAELAERRQQK